MEGCIPCPPQHEPGASGVPAGRWARPAGASLSRIGHSYVPPEGRFAADEPAELTGRRRAAERVGRIVLTPSQPGVGSMANIQRYSQSGLRNLAELLAAMPGSARLTAEGGIDRPAKVGEQGT